MKTRCHICKSLKIKELEFSKNIKFIYSDGSPTILKKKIYYCESCSNVFTDVNLSFEKKLKKFYQRYHKSKYLPKYRTSSNKINYINNKRSEVMSSFIIKHITAKKKIDLIDIGCSKGDLLNSISKKTNFNLFGFDLTKSFRNQLENIKNFKKFYLENIENIDKKFDVIVLSHVIEHIKDPSNYLINLSRILKSNGLIFLQVPYSIKKPFDFIVIDHLTNFSKHGFRFLIENSKLEILQLSSNILTNEIVCVAKKKNISRKNKVRDLFNKFYNNIVYINNYVSFLRNLDKSKKIIIYTAGNSGIFSAFNIINWQGFFIDDDKSKQNKKYFNKLVLKAKKISDDQLVLLPFKSEAALNMIKKNKYLSKENTIFYYD